MTESKGRILRMEEKLKAMQEKAQNRESPLRRLRSNELNRLLSIQNKLNWKTPLTQEDEQDLEEIKDIQEGRKAMIHPEQKYFQAAFTRHWDGRLCWFQNLDEGPLRELTAEEKTVWEKTGPVTFQGYIRTDGTIKAYVLSGSDKHDPQLSPTRTSSKKPADSDEG